VAQALCLLRSRGAAARATKGTARVPHPSVSRVRLCRS